MRALYRMSNDERGLAARPFVGQKVELGYSSSRNAADVTTYEGTLIAVSTFMGQTWQYAVTLHLNDARVLTFPLSVVHSIRLAS